MKRVYVRKRTAKQKRAVQGYELPPLCRNCLYYDREQMRDTAVGPRYVPPMCIFGNFPVEPIGVCDEWRGKDGSSLAA